MKLRNITFAWLSSLLMGSAVFSSCESYLDVDKYVYDLTTLDSVFSRKDLLVKYINSSADYLPKEDKLWTNSYTPYAFMSDEAFCSWNDDRHAAIKLPLGEIDRFSGYFNNWGGYYKGIRKANLIIERIGECADISEMERRDYTGQAYFLRAYLYYALVRQYGPVPILPDKAFPTNESVDNLSYPRGTYDECIEYICKNMETAAAMLDTSRDSEEYFKIPTQGAALALLSRIRLEAASPWFNGKSPYYSDFVRTLDGAYYFPQTYDPNKWGIAAVAAKRVIDTNQYELYTVARNRNTPELPDNISQEAFPNGAGNIDPFKSYNDMFTAEEPAINVKELIWTRDESTDLAWIAFPAVMKGGNGLNVSQALVDAYRMVDGCDINQSSEAYPYPSDAEAAEPGDAITFSDYQLPANVAKMYRNREMRFYATIGFNHAFWEASGYTGTEVNNKNVEVTYYSNGTGAAWSDYPYDRTFSGYTSRKYVHSSDTPNGSKYRTKHFPIIRYAEVLLNYVEAMNEMENEYTDEEIGITVSRDVNEMKKYFNMIRYRAGLPGVTDAELADKETMRSLIKRERQVEFALEGHRFYDLRRWGDLMKTMNTPFVGMDVTQNSSHRVEYHRRTIMTYRYSLYNLSNKMLLYPIKQSIIDKNPKIDQNPGW